jgi:hypothetical protein
MRRFLPVCALSALAAIPVVAASWHTFHSTKLGFTVRYPAGWHVAESAATPRSQSVSFGYQGSTPYSLTVTVASVRPARTIRATLAALRTVDRETGGPAAAAVHWSATTLDRHPALWSVIRPPTEGGVAMSEGLLVSQSSHHVYEIEAVSYQRQAPKRFSDFPVLYRNILASWRFL